MPADHSASAQLYFTACKREHAAVSDAFVEALDKNAKSAVLGQGGVPLNDIDVCCVAEVVGTLRGDSQLRVLVLEENSFGLSGVTMLMEAIEANPGHIRELRLGKNNLKDQAAVVIGHTLSRSGCGIKVLDLSESGITKFGVIPIAAALQHPSSDVVELSFHNNKIEGDAATYLGQALRDAPKLRHLHLGYNTLRDTGAAQLARSIPHAKCLSTLDLTANRIGREGGEELVRALLSPTCTVQRLNLRHNQLDSATIELFADVISKNTSLIQLFLGFMNPSPESAAAVLAAVPQNATLLLLDIYGWKLNPANILPLIEGIQERNGTLAALVTDACQPIAAEVDRGNVIREDERDLHPLYVGPDDRDAYLATKSLRRYSRAQSRRQSRTASRVQSRARADGQSPSRRESSQRRGERSGSRPGSRSSRAVSSADKNGKQDQSSRSHRSSSAHSHHRHEGAHRRGHRDGASPNSKLIEENPPRSRTPPVANATSKGEAGQLVPLSPQNVDASVEALLSELEETPCEPRTKGVLKAIIKALHSSSMRQRVQIRDLTARVELLEGRDGGFRGGPGSRTSPGDSRAPLGFPGRGVDTSTNIGADGRFGSSSEGYRRIPSSGAIAPPSQQALDASSLNGHTEQTGQSSPAAKAFHRSISRVSQSTTYTVMERCTTPHVSQDAPPDIARPNDESGEPHPEGVELQRSASIQNFPPRIEPSPAQDANPPRRKSISHTF